MADGGNVLGRGRMKSVNTKPSSSVPGCEMENSSCVGTSAADFRQEPNSSRKHSMCATMCKLPDISPYH